MGGQREAIKKETADTQMEMEKKKMIVEHLKLLTVPHIILFYKNIEDKL